MPYSLLLNSHTMKILAKQLILATATATCLAASAQLSEREQAYLAQKGEIVFVSQPRHAPFEFLHKKQVSGMNVELVQWMAADLGFKARFEVAPLTEAMEMLRKGEADAMTSLFHSSEREAEFEFTQSLKTTPVCLYVRSDRTDIESIYGLEGKRVAIMGSGRALEVLQQHDISTEIKFVPTTEECVELVLSGKSDAMIGNELVTQHHLYDTGEGGLRVVGEPLFTARLCMAVAEGNRDLLSILEKGIASAQKSGTLYKIQAKWLGSEYSRHALPLKTILVYTAIAASAVALALLTILAWNRKLQHTVAERTRQFAESEERLRQIFENSPDAVFVLDPEGHILSANSSACALVKMEKQDLLKKSVYDLVPAPFHGEVTDNMHKWFSGELKQCEGVSMDSAGTVRPIEMTGTLQNLGGRTVLQLHARDIALRKEAEDKIHAARQIAEDAKEMAENASQAKSEFLANMSHEIRTPLNGIVGMAQLLADTPLTSEQQNCVDTVLQSTSGLLNIINHVLDISKIEAGQMDVHPSSIDLRELCDNLYYMFQPLAERTGIQLSFACQESVPPYVVGDEGLIDQILVNLVGNALKFTHHGSVTLNIECPRKTPAGAEIYFQVIDTGIGIAKEKQATVFEKFIQADGSTKRLYGGTGLGLAISKQLVELMGGKIGLISSPGKGSTFYFNLTLPQSDLASIPRETEREKAKTVNRPGIRVMLVEDNQVNQKVAIAILRKAGCEVVAVDNGQDAIQRIRQQPFDVVLMDCQMPVMDGFEATAHIRRMRKPLCDIPIIAITAHAMKDDKQKCIEHGMDDYIAKPVGRQALVDIINKHTA